MSHELGRRLPWYQLAFTVNFKTSVKRLSVNLTQALQAQCEHGRQKYKDLYGNPDKKLKKIII